MSVRPRTPIGERVRKRRRGEGGDVVDDHTDDPATPSSPSSETTDTHAELPSSPLTPGPQTPSSAADSPSLLTPLTPLTPSTDTRKKDVPLAPDEVSLQVETVSKIMPNFVPKDLHGSLMRDQPTAASLEQKNNTTIMPIAAVTPAGSAALAAAHAPSPSLPATLALGAAVELSRSAGATNEDATNTRTPAQTPGAIADTNTRPVQAQQGNAAIVPLTPPAPLGIGAPQPLPGLEDVPAAVIAVAMQVSNTALPNENIYGLSVLPPGLDWGRGRQERKLSAGRASTYVRFAGRVQTTWFFDRNGTPQSRVNVGVSLLLDTDEEAMHSLFQKAKPPANVPEVVFASRLQGQRERGSFTEKVVPFRNVFNAQDGVLSKTEARRINAVDFTDNDVIVVEGEVTRWKPDRSPGWNKFDVGFDLTAIYLVWISP